MTEGGGTAALLRVFSVHVSETPALAKGCFDPRRQAAGVPARTIMEVLGHSAIGVTMNTYTHVLALLRQDAADAIDKGLGT